MKTSCRSSALLRKGGDYLNVTINRAEMLCAIKRASAIAPADSPLDVLRGVLLEADAAAGKLTVTSTNLEAALEEKLPCTVQEDGALVFGAKMLAEMLSRLPQDMSLTYGRHIVHRVTDCFICAALGAKHKDSLHAAIPSKGA